MADLTDEQIKQEFKRQVRLCSGLGRKQMICIVNRYFDENIDLTDFDHERLPKLDKVYNDGLNREQRRRLKKR